jgi:hypothetical protein
MTGIACNSTGICYGIDLSTDGLWSINLETGECTLIGPLGIMINFATGFSFDKDTDILYLICGNSLCTCDTETGECSLVSNMGIYVSALAIPYNCNPTTEPVTKISFNPPLPDGDNNWYISNVTVSLNATDEDGINTTYYKINGGEWNIYSSPFIISEDGEDILIDYYSIDILGNIEDIKSSMLNIDKTPPEIIIDYNVTKIGWKEWLVEFYFTVSDSTSGSGTSLMDKVEVFINGILFETVDGPGPIYSWSFIFKSGLKIIVGAGAWDKAGNYGYNETQVKLNRNCKQQSNHPSLSINSKNSFLTLFIRNLGV